MIRSHWYPQKHKNNNYDNINPTNLISGLEEDKILNVLLLKRTKSLVLLYLWLKIFLRSDVEIISSFLKEKDISFSLVIFFNISDAPWTFTVAVSCELNVLFSFSWKVFEGFSPRWAQRDQWPFLQRTLKYYIHVKLHDLFWLCYQ